MNGETESEEAKLRRAMGLIDGMNPSEMEGFMRCLMASVMRAEAGKHANEKVLLGGMSREERIVDVVAATFPFPPKSFWASEPMVPAPEEWWNNEASRERRGVYLGLNSVVRCLAFAMLDKLPANKWLTEGMASLMGLMRGIEMCLRSEPLTVENHGKDQQ